MKKNIFYPILLIAGIFFLTTCATETKILSWGTHYQAHQDIESLKRVVRAMPRVVDTAYVRRVLGEPIDFGFDYRYLVDSTGPNGCVVGAVFHINDAGKIDQRWIGEICE